MNNENINEDNIYNDVVKREINLCKVARNIANKYQIIYCAGNFYKYESGYYQQLDVNEINKCTKDILADSFNIHRANEVNFALKADCFIDIAQLDKTNLLNLRNGLLDLDTFKLQSHSPEIYTTIQLQVKYEPNAVCPKWEKTVDEIFQSDKNSINTLQEFFGLCLTRETKYHKALFCIGDGANGKSTVLETLEAILGMRNYSAIPLERFDNTHYLAGLLGKLANISIETNAKSSIYDSTFKAIVSGDAITADYKFGHPFTFNPFCKLIFALNNMPRVDDKTSAFFRRLIILRFNRTFLDIQQNKNLDIELLSELDGIFLWALKGLDRLNKRGRFEENAELLREIAEYKLENNNVLVFVEERCRLDAPLSISKDSLYADYSAWCERSGYRALSKLKFGKELKKQFNIITDSRTSDTREWQGIDTI